MEDTTTNTYHYTDEYVGYRGREHAAKSLRDALDEVVAEVRSPGPEEHEPWRRHHLVALQNRTLRPLPGR